MGSRFDLLPGSDEGCSSFTSESGHVNDLFTAVWEGDSSSGTASWSCPTDVSAALDVSSEAICFGVRALVHSHALFLFQSPVFGLLFLHQPLLGGNRRWSSLQAGKHTWEMRRDDSPGIFFLRLGGLGALVVAHSETVLESFN